MNKIAVSHTTTRTVTVHISSYTSIKFEISSQDQRKLATVKCFYDKEELVLDVSSFDLLELKKIIDLSLSDLNG